MENKSQLLQTDPLDALHNAHSACMIAETQSVQQIYKTPNQWSLSIMKLNAECGKQATIVGLLLITLVDGGRAVAARPSCCTQRLSPELGTKLQREVGLL